MSKATQFVPSSNYVPVQKGYSDPAYTAVNGDMVLADTTSGAFTVTLPASPEGGDRLLIVDANNNFSTNNLTLGRNSSNIDGAASDYTCDGTVNTIELIYSGDATVGWSVRSGTSAPSAPSVGSYGYLAGGYTTAYVSYIERMEFPFDSGTASNIGNLSESRHGSAGSNSTEYGYSAGGFNSVPSVFYFSTIDRIVFPFESGTATHTGNLSVSTRLGASYNSSTHGYITAGYVGSFQNSIKRFTFPMDSGTGSTVGNISYSGEGLAGFNSSTHGFMTGGNTTMYFATISRITFPHDSGAASAVGNMSGSRAWFQGCNSSAHGFIIAGYDGAVRRSLVDRVAFPFDSGTASNVGNINTTGSNNMCINSSLYGFSCGLSNAGGSVSTIDRITFPFASGTATSVGTLATGHYSGAAIDETDFVTQFV